MTLQASGQITLKDIYEELEGITYVSGELSLFLLYQQSHLTTKTDNKALSDFYGYLHWSFGGWGPSLVLAGRAAGSSNPTVTSQGYGWTIKTKDSWLTLAPTSLADASGKYVTPTTVSYTLNTGGDRVGTIVLIQNTSLLESTLTVQQDGFDIEVDPTSNNIIADAGTYQDLTDLLADDDWSVTSQPSWVTTVSPSSGTQTASQLIDFTVTQNTTGDARVGIITFKLDSYSIEVDFTLTQEAGPP